MAFVAMLGTHVTGGVAGEQMVEGLAVVMNPSGIHNDLPVVNIAQSGDRNVFIVIVPPDQFPRPTPFTAFMRNPVMTIDPRNSTPFLIDSGQRGPFYLIGPSLLEAPVIYSGWAVQLHKGGAYTLTSECFVDSTAIRRNGATVGVTTGGKFQYTTNSSQIVGFVREWRNGNLTVVLDQRSA